MFPIWQRLARAREWRQLSIDQLGQLSGLAVETVIALENNDLARLPSDVDPSTALRAYAAAVGLDPDKVLRHYLGDQNAVSQSITPRSGAPPDIVVIEPRPADMDEFPSELETESDPRWSSVPPGEPATSQDWPSEAPDVPQPLPSRAASASLRDTDDVGVNASDSKKRIYVSAAVATIIAVGIYSIWWKEPAHPSSTPTQVSVARPGRAPSSGTPHPTARDPVQHIERQSVDAGAGPVAAENLPTAAPVERPNHAAPAAAPRSEGEELDGWWDMTNQVESASYSRYRGLRLGYRLQLHQDGRQITGRGQKWRENGRRIPIASRTPITVVGLVEGRRVTLSFTERGIRRVSAGTFELQLTNGSLSGTFESDAARSHGSSVARRVSLSERSARPQGLE